MTNFSVTLADLRKEGACFSGYNKVVRAIQGREFSVEDEERESYIRFSYKDSIGIESIAHSNGLDDALWALRCVKDANRDLRLYAVWCARHVQYLMSDQRSINAVDVAERHAFGLATSDELSAAGDAAWDAARAAAGAAARDAARAAAGAAAWAAARAAAGDAAWAAARAAAGDAAWAAAGAAAWAAARDAAGDAAWAAQKDMLVKMCNGQAPWQLGKKS